jgi:hypothetical protein
VEGRGDRDDLVNERALRPSEPLVQVRYAHHDVGRPRPPGNFADRAGDVVVVLDDQVRAEHSSESA